QGLDHMRDESVIGFAARRDAAMEAAEKVSGRALDAPIVKRKRWVGNDDVKFLQSGAFEQLGVVECVAPFDARAVFAVQEHIHSAERPYAAVRLLSEEREIIVADLLGHADQQRSRTARRVADARPFLRLEQFGDQSRDLRRCVKIAALLAGL